MALSGQSFLDVEALSLKTIQVLFQKATKLKKTSPLPLGSKVLGLLFFEPSTRTRASFEMAAFRLGVKPLFFDPSQSSMVKGETIEDTALTLEALGASALVLRHSSPGMSLKISQLIKIPVINAGDGQRGHPTQALLDAYTIEQERGQLAGEKVLFVGDVKYSRVARSDIALFQKMGAEVAICAPSTLRTSEHDELKSFKSVTEGLEWASVCVMLRMQIERQKGFEVPSLKEYSKRFSITPERLKNFRSDGILLHPGPFNREVELAVDVLKDPRTRILKQVENGVFMRGALLSEILGVDF
ncbi:MAG: aspartate carbamoyltransferase catalytic subunit [Bdellovibrionales bacterium]